MSRCHLQHFLTMKFMFENHCEEFFEISTGNRKNFVLHNKFRTAILFGRNNRLHLKWLKYKRLVGLREAAFGCIRSELLLVETANQNT